MCLKKKDNLEKKNKKKIFQLASYEKITMVYTRQMQSDDKSSHDSWPSELTKVNIVDP